MKLESCRNPWSQATHHPLAGVEAPISVLISSLLAKREILVFKELRASSIGIPRRCEGDTIELLLVDLHFIATVDSGHSGTQASGDGDLRPQVEC